MSDLQRDLLRSKLPSHPPMNSRPTKWGKRDYTPVPWDKYFEKREDVAVEDGSVFRVYRSQSANYTEDKPCIFLLHGAGYSGLTWACFVSDIITMIECSVIAMDIRGHGETRTKDEDDLSAETMTNDVNMVYETIFKDHKVKPPLILVGHSMGGALGVHVAASDRIPSLVGLTVIDVVEGTALDALQGMQTVLRSRPKSFGTLDKAIEWSCRSGQTKNLESAKVSMPAMLKRVGDDEPATMKETHTEDSSASEALKVTHGIPEDDEVDFNASEKPVEKGYTWRIDLSRSEPHWRGWFENLSSTFLSIQCPKLLLLAGVDRLDKDLTIGQMQGKFQTQVLPKVGHAVHEDAPLKVAEAISAFLVRNKICEKIGDFDNPSVCC